MAFELPKLPYDYDALEPYIDKETMHLHHEKHHKAYLDNLNKTLEGHLELANKAIEQVLTDLEIIPDGIKQAVINFGGGHANHSFFWKIMAKPEGQKPEGKILDALNSEFGSFDKFKEEFTAKAMGVFGSGWAFLILNPDKKLQLKRHSFQNSPLSTESKPLLTIDVWEHAYYLKYQNKRLDYINAWWNVVNWRQIEANFVSAL